MTMKHLRRRRLLIDRSLQVRFIAASLAYVAFYVVMMALATFAPLIFDLHNSHPDSHQAYLVAKNLVYLHQHIWPITLLVLILVTVHSLWLSHKVAGPLFRFRKVFKALVAGRLPGTQRLRKRDYLKPEMQLINEMLQGLHSRMEILQETQKAVADSISGVARRSRILADSELTRLVEELEVQGKRLEKHAIPFDKES